MVGGVTMETAAPRRRTRIQQEKRELILEAALEVFSANGFRGSTIDQIAEAAGMSKPNLLYYFRRKEDIHTTLMQRLLDTWLAPLRELDDIGDPLTELRSYIRRKLEMARDYPRESRLFANEIFARRATDHAVDRGRVEKSGRREGRGHQWMDARRQDRQDRPPASHLLDLGDDAALC